MRDPKYSIDELQEMATIFLQFKASGDERCGMLLMMLSYVAGLNESECLQKIELLAQGIPQ